MCPQGCLEDQAHLDVEHLRLFFKWLFYFSSGVSKTQLNGDRNLKLALLVCNFGVPGGLFRLCSDLAAERLRWGLWSYTTGGRLMSGAGGRGPAEEERGSGSGG